MARNPLLFGVAPPARGASRRERLCFVRALGDRSAICSAALLAVATVLGIGTVGLVAVAVTVAGGLANHVSITRKIRHLDP